MCWLFSEDWDSICWRSEEKKKNKVVWGERGEGQNSLFSVAVKNQKGQNFHSSPLLLQNIFSTEAQQQKDMESISFTPAIASAFPLCSILY